MRLLLIGLGVLLGATVVLAAVLRIVLAIARRSPKRFWRRTGIVVLVSVPIHLFITMPVVLGWMGSRIPQTRGDESAYAGPRIGPDGSWMVQSKDTLDAEARGEIPVDPATTAATRELEVRFTAADGIALRAFLVPPLRKVPLCSVVLVHGLFRGGLELEPVADMFRDLGAEVLLLELRNHGASERAPATFGLGESLDVIAAAEYLRRDPARRTRPLVLFGVSLGTAAVGMAADRIEELGGLVLDAPMDQLAPTAHRMLGGRLAMPQPFRSLVLSSLEMWSGFDIEAVRPGDVLRQLDPATPVLLIGGSEDKRMPPNEVQELFDGLPTQPDRKQLWIRPGSDHGSVWRDDPASYARHLKDFLEIVTAPR